MRLEEVLRLVKRFIINEMQAIYGSVNPIKASLDEKSNKWTITCEYTYNPGLFMDNEDRIVELILNNVSGQIEKFRNVK